MNLIETYYRIIWRNEANLIIEQVEKEEEIGKKLSIDDLSNETKEEVMRITNNLPGKRGFQKWMFARLLKKQLNPEDVYKYGEHDGIPGFFEIFIKVKDLPKSQNSPNHFSSNDVGYYKSSDLVSQFEFEAIKSYDSYGKLSGETTKEDKGNILTTSQISTLGKYGVIYLGMTEDGYQSFKVPPSLAGDEEAFKIYKNLLGDCVEIDKEGKRTAGTINICTIGSFSHFNSYLSSGKTLYVFFNRKDPLSPYQFCYENGEFKDRTNRSLI